MRKTSIFFAAVWLSLSGLPTPSTCAPIRWDAWFEPSKEVLSPTEPLQVRFGVFNGSYTDVLDGSQDFGAAFYTKTRDGMPSLSDFQIIDPQGAFDRMRGITLAPRSSVVIDLMTLVPNPSSGTQTGNYEMDTALSYAGSTMYMGLNWRVAATPGMGTQALNPSMLLGSVGAATNSAPSVVANWRDGYTNTQQQLMDCINNPDCKPEKERRLQGAMQDTLQDHLHDIQSATVVAAQTVEAPINMSSVDMTVWDASKLGRLINGASALDSLKSMISSAFDFLGGSSKAQSHPELSLMAVGEGSSAEPLIINSISGTIWADSHDGATWLLSDLDVNAEVAKSYYNDFAPGDMFGTTAGILPSSESFGVLTVKDFVDPPGYNNVNFSLRNVELLDSEGAVPEPSASSLVGVGLALLVLTKRRRNGWSKA
jgi:hypothetical protein